MCNCEFTPYPKGHSQENKESVTYKENPLNKKKFLDLCKIPKWSKNVIGIKTASGISSKYGGIIDMLYEVLIKQVLDSRQCPHCEESFVPRDKTAEDASDLLALLFRKTELTGTTKLDESLFIGKPVLDYILKTVKEMDEQNIPTKDRHIKLPMHFFITNKRDLILWKNLSIT